MDALIEFSKKFPDIFVISMGRDIDNNVRAFARNYRDYLDVVRSSIAFTVRSIESGGLHGMYWWLLVLSVVFLGYKATGKWRSGVLYGALVFLIGTFGLRGIPWWVIILVVAFSGYKATGKWQRGVLYGALIFLIGVFGLWVLMIETMSVITISVIVSLIIGFPLGISVAMSEKVNAVVRPILDLAQTMPTFVYLIPAAMLLGVGKVPAVIATVIYAVVPMVRMTSHGIIHVDKDVIEASTAFGATRFQTLVKVQIPQALPTIMTGVNQTIMMAMAMVVTCSLIGAGGLGLEILIGTQRVEIGRALMPGVSIVILACILDRITQGMARHDEEDGEEIDGEGEAT